MSVRETIEHKLTTALNPSRLVVVDESRRHAGHAGMRNGDGHAGDHGETHFQVEIVSASFVGQSRVARQRTVYALLADELQGGVHALSLTTLTPEEAATRR
jgi:BolA protein